MGVPAQACLVEPCRQRPGTLPQACSTKDLGKLRLRPLRCHGVAQPPRGGDSQVGPHMYTTLRCPGRPQGRSFDRDFGSGRPRRAAGHEVTEGHGRNDCERKARAACTAPRLAASPEFRWRPAAAGVRAGGWRELPAPQTGGGRQCQGWQGRGPRVAEKIAGATDFFFTIFRIRQKIVSGLNRAPDWPNRHRMGGTFLAYDSIAALVEPVMERAERCRTSISADAGME